MCWFFSPALPDSHGWIDPSLRPIWDLAFLGSSYVMWERTTQTLHYYMAQLSSVNQWVSKTLRTSPRPKSYNQCSVLRLN